MNKFNSPSGTKKDHSHIASGLPFILCRGEVIRTLDPLLPKQVR